MQTHAAEAAGLTVEMVRPLSRADVQQKFAGSEHLVAALAKKGHSDGGRDGGTYFSSSFFCLFCYGIDAVQVIFKGFYVYTKRNFIPFTPSFTCTFTLVNPYKFVTTTE